MEQIFVEMYKYRQAWIDMNIETREQVRSAILTAMTDISSGGVEIIGWGFNDLETDCRAPYDFFCIYKVPSFAFQRGFDKSIRESGWHDLFEQIAVSGALATPADILSANIALLRPEPRIDQQ